MERTLTLEGMACRVCHVVKPFDSFGRLPNDAHRKICKTCRSRRDAEVYASDPERPRWRMVRYRYGIDKADYLALLESQGGVCAICKENNPSVRKATGERYAFHIDHDHETGKIRGLLCHRCNNGIGFLTSKEVLTAAISYLERG